jgi:hypothetical protein
MPHHVPTKKKLVFFSCAPCCIPRTGDVDQVTYLADLVQRHYPNLQVTPLIDRDDLTRFRREEEIYQSYRSKRCNSTYFSKASK